MPKKSARNPRRSGAVEFGPFPLGPAAAASDEHVRAFNEGGLAAVDPQSRKPPRADSVSLTSATALASMRGEQPKDFAQEIIFEAIAGHAHRPGSPKSPESPISFTVHGEAKPAGSKRPFKGKRRDGSEFISIVDACKGTKSWQHQVSTAAREAYEGPLLEGPLVVSIAFYVVRPKGHYGKRGLKPNAAAWPTKRPDVLKLARAVEDALTGVIYRDDAQIVIEHLQKNFGESAKVAIDIKPLT